MAGLLTCPDSWPPSRPDRSAQWINGQKHTIPSQDRVYSSGNCTGFSPDSQLSRVAPIHHKFTQKIIWWNKKNHYFWTL